MPAVKLTNKRWQPLATASVVVAAMLILPGLAQATDSSPAARRTSANARRIDTSHSRPVTRTEFRVTNTQHTSNRSTRGASTARQSKSVIARAAHDEVIMEMPPEIVSDGSIVEAACGFEPGCGIEGGCGVESCCGPAVGCGAEMAPYCAGPGLCGGCNLCGGPAGCDAMPMYDNACDSLSMSGVECVPLLLPITRINWGRFDIFAGVHAFSGPPSYAGADGVPLDQRDGTASFGLQQGFNYTAPSAFFGRALSLQLGLRASQTNASGAEFTADNRKQLFFTGGFFRRVDYGLQYGVVCDVMYDDWYYNVDMAQLRGQLSWMMDPCNEFGYQFAASLSDDMSSGVIRLPGNVTQVVNVMFDPLDQHRFFYRRHFKQAGHFDMFAGFTDQDDGLLGMSMEVPLIDGLGLRSGFTYLNPDLSGGAIDNQEESWNIGMGFVWYPCGTFARSKYDVPMFSVADNGNFLMDQDRN